MANETMEILPDGNLKISVDARTQQEVKEQFADYDAAMQAAREDPSEANLRRLRITYEPSLFDVLSGDTFSPCCNGWDYIHPAEISALKDDACIIVADDVERDDMGNLIAIHGHGGAVFYDNFYAVRNPMRDIAQDGYVVFWRSDPE